jgi:hypothetical protein
MINVSHTLFAFKVKNSNKHGGLAVPVFTERFEGLPQTVQVEVPSVTCVKLAQISPISPQDIEQLA